jgi:maleylacetoacetate isomerase/maleylpyruvate isomerase
MKLYDYFRSTAAYRVRIALNIKHINYEKIPINLLEETQHTSRYAELNPQGLVPTLDENGHILTQSLAIIEYLDEINPEPPLLPPNPLGRAQVKRLALSIACDIHPINNLRVLTQLRNQFNSTDEQIKTWYQHWLILGFQAFETTLHNLPRKEPVCFGSDITLADIFLIPQVYNAKRYALDLSPYPLITAINDHCLTLPAFLAAKP